MNGSTDGQLSRNAKSWAILFLVVEGSPFGPQQKKAARAAVVVIYVCLNSYDRLEPMNSTDPIGLSRFGSLQPCYMVISKDPQKRKKGRTWQQGG